MKSWMNGTSAWALAMVVWIFLAANASAAVYYVDGEKGNDANDGLSWANAKQTIRAATDLATKYSDQVWVRQGYYRINWGEDEYGIRLTGTLLGGFKGNELYAENREEDPSLTMIDGGMPDTSEGRGSIIFGGNHISGFTITGGNSTTLAGGVSNVSSIVKCIITQNKGVLGGGVHNVWSSMEDCIITNNEAVLGGGIYMDGGRLIINRTRIMGNHAQSGAGIYALDGGLFGLVSSLVVHNSAIEGGGGIYLKNCSPDIIYCTFDSNRANVGDGIFMIGNNAKINGNSSPKITGCAFTNHSNSALYGWGTVSYEQRYSNIPANITYSLFNNNGVDLYSKYYGARTVSGFTGISDTYGNNFTHSPGYNHDLNNQYVGDWDEAHFDPNSNRTEFVDNSGTFPSSILDGVLLNKENSIILPVVEIAANSIWVVGKYELNNDTIEYSVLDYTVDPNSGLFKKGRSSSNYGASINGIYPNGLRSIGAYEYGVGTLKFSGAKALSVNSLELQISGGLSNSNYLAYINWFKLSGDGIGTLRAYANSTSGNFYNGKTVFYWTGEMKDGGDITIEVSKFAFDNDRLPYAEPRKVTFAGIGRGVHPNYNSLKILNSREIRVVFSEQLNSIESLDPLSYTISGPGRGTLAEHPDSVEKVDDVTVRLEWASGSMAGGEDVTISVSPELRDLAGNKIEGTLSRTLAKAGLRSVPPTMLCVTDAGHVWGAQAINGHMTPSEFWTTIPFTDNAAEGRGVLAADLNADQYDDLIAIDADGKVWGMLNNQHHDFEQANLLVDGMLYDPMAGWIVVPMDVNGDQWTDLVQLSGTGNTLISWNEQGTGFSQFDLMFVGQPIYHEGLGAWIGRGDFDGDGRDDLLSVESLSGKMNVYRGMEDRLHTVPIQSAFGYKFGLNTKRLPIVGDFNGDGVDDIANTTQYGDIWVAKGNGGAFGGNARWGWLGFFFDPNAGNGRSVYAADMNLDGRDDMVQLTEFGEAWVALSTGSSFAEPVRFGQTGFRNTPHGPWRSFIGKFE